MGYRLSRRQLLQSVALQCLATLPGRAAAGPLRGKDRGPTAWVSGNMTGAEALVETLIKEGVDCVFGIPGAQNNELWDTMKTKHLGYVLVTHEFSAAAMADGYARSTGKPGVVCVVPGPGLTNSLTGIGEALLDSVPLVCIVCDVARGCKYHPFQVHELPHVALMQAVMKEVYTPQSAGDIPEAVRRAMACARAGEPGPVGVLIPHPLFIEPHNFNSPPLEPAPLPFDGDAFQTALALLADRKRRVGIYAGMGCMDYACELVRVAELLQAPVATSVSGKGVIPENQPLSVGWGYGPQGTRTAEEVFKHVGLILAIGVRFSEVSTAFYSVPEQHAVIHVDANPKNLGAVVKRAHCVHADAGAFLAKLQEHADVLCRPADKELAEMIAYYRNDEAKTNAQIYAKGATDPMAFVLALRRCLPADALLYVDVTATEHWAAEAYAAFAPRTYFNPTDNQEMGWSIPAALGGQRAHPGRVVATITGDGCFLMSAMEISTAAREGLPVKFFVLDDHAYHVMQMLQKAAYKRTTATVLASVDYEALARGFGVGYNEIRCTENLEAGIRAALCHDGPVLTRVITEYGKRPSRWVAATKHQFTKQLTTEQKMHFLARLGGRSLHWKQDND